jgi:mannose-6-phosphate isomerase-like protein (cupin superfamily)
MNYKIPMLFSLMFGIISVNAQKDSAWQKTSLHDLIRKQNQTRDNKLLFLNTGTLQGVLWKIYKHQKLHDTDGHDRIFYVLEGHARCKAGDSVFILSRGTTLSMPARAGGLFYGSVSRLRLYELISLAGKRDTIATATAARCFTKQQTEAPREQGNVWNPFVKTMSLIFGLYMLPKSTGGDSALTHKWDEVNFIVNGSGKFQVNNQIMDIIAGDVIYVQKGNPHYFHSLQNNTDILIFFEKKSVENQ